MTHVEAVRTELLAAAAVTALVSTRIYPGKAPEQAVRPFIVMRVISDVPDNVHGGSPSTRLRDVRLQIDCYAVMNLAANAIATAVDDVVGALARHDLSAQRLNQREFFEEETKLHCVSADFLVQR